MVVHCVLWGTEGARGAIIDAIVGKGSILPGELELICLICELERLSGCTRFQGLCRRLLLFFDSIVVVSGRRVNQVSFRLLLWLD